MTLYIRLLSDYGVGDAFSHTYREEGLILLWRGNTVNIIWYFLTQALNFAFSQYPQPPLACTPLT